MKKISFFVAIAAAASLASCTAQAPKANMKNDVDSLSYMIVPSRPPFFIGVILRLMFVAGGTFPPATAYCFLKVGNAPLSS